VIIPCIDLMDGKVVQLVKGRQMALEAGSPLETLRRFSGFPEIQVIDLDAAMDKGSNGELVRLLAGRAIIRAGGGVRSVARARELVAQGASKVIVGTAALGPDGPNAPFLSELAGAIGKNRVIVGLDSRHGRVVVKGWRESTCFSAWEIMRQFEPYCGGFACTYVDKEGMLQGTDLDLFRRLRAATALELTAAGGITTMEEIRCLQDLPANVALGMAIYTGRLDLDQLHALARGRPQ
jgi:phosphoribosylformimino-5-aminoimidazole carboxamide ribotide isomerase